jgi:hypothetical protein
VDTLLADIARVAIALGNCAAEDSSYREKVARKESLLIALTRTTGKFEKPFALAECRIVQVHGRVGVVWGQMRETNCNAKPEACAHFHAMNGMLGAWVASRPPGFWPPGKASVLDMKEDKMVIMMVMVLIMMIMMTMMSVLTIMVIYRTIAGDHK